MTDPRYTKLARLLVNYSTQIKKGDRALLDMIDVPDEMAIALIRAVRAAGGTPFVETRHTRVGREQLLGINEKQAADIRDIEMFRMKKMQAYIAIRGSANISENSDVPSDRMQLYSRVIRPVQDYRLFAGDLGDRVAQVFLVVERDVGEDGEQRIDDVGGVEPAAHADFQDGVLNDPRRSEERS